MELNKRYLEVYKNGTSGEIMIEPEPYNHIDTGEGEKPMSEIRVAHCIVGQARSIRLPCVRQTLEHNLFAALHPWVDVQRSFVHFSTSPREKLRLVKRGVQDVDDIATLERLAWTLPFVRNVSVAPGQAPACLAPKVRDASTIVMWNAIRACFEMVRAYERAHGYRFSLVSRIRPDAVFFSKLPRVDSLSLAVAWLPRGGLLHACSQCANDHLALVHRAVAERYFKHISEKASDCSLGTSFNAQWNDVRRSSHLHKGVETHFGPGFGYAAVGLPVRHIAWPYALSARGCTNASCMALQCHRLPTPSLSAQCRRWRCTR